MQKKLLKNILNSSKNLEKITYKIMKNGFKFCFFLCIISTLILSLYNSTYSLNAYNIGISLFKLSIYFTVEFIICGFIVDSIKKKLIWYYVIMKKQTFSYNKVKKFFNFKKKTLDFGQVFFVLFNILYFIFSILLKTFC